MNSTGTTKENVSTNPSAGMVQIVANNQAITYAGSFMAFRGIIERCPQLKRPNRNRPIPQGSAELIAATELAIATPPLSELRKLAKDNSPPVEFFDGDIERPW